MDNLALRFIRWSAGLLVLGLLTGYGPLGNYLMGGAEDDIEILNDPRSSATEKVDLGRRFGTAPCVSIQSGKTMLELLRPAAKRILVHHDSAGYVLRCLPQSCRANAASVAGDGAIPVNSGRIGAVQEHVEQRQCVMRPLTSTIGSSLLSDFPRRSAMHDNLDAGQKSPWGQQ